MTNLDSKIEWCDTTWNPVNGCTKVSSGCDNCYAETLTERFHGKGSFAEIKLHPARLDAPLRWRKPRRIFVNSMSDLFHDKVPDDFIAQVWAVMSMAPLQTFQILTKRHGRMRSLLNSPEFWMMVGTRGRGIAMQRAQGKYPSAGPMVLTSDSSADGSWEAVHPLPNVWGGVSVENQATAQLRIPALIETPLAVRFLSCEPLLGPVDLSMVKTRGGTLPVAPLQVHYDQDTGAGHHPISWVICGGESGRVHRLCDPEWIRSLVEQCKGAGVPVFVKQDSGPRPGLQGRIPDDVWAMKEFPA